MFGNQTRVEEALRQALAQSRLVADDGDVPIVVQYKAPDDTAINRFAGISIDAAGDLNFFRGSTLATLTVQTNISGAANGRIDVSNAAYNTIGEVVDRINAFTATHGWRAMAVDALRSDSSNSTLNALTRTNAGCQSTGRELLWDTDDTARHKLTISIKKFRRFVSGRTGVPTETGWQPVLRRITSNVNFVTGSTRVQVYDRIGTVETLRQQFQGGADATDSTKDYANNDPLGGYFGPANGEVLVVVGSPSTFGTWSNGYLNVEYKNVNCSR